jgi:hypothetical protein
MENGVNPEGNSLSLDQGAELLSSMLVEPEKREENPEREAGDPARDNEADATDQVSEEETDAEEPDTSDDEDEGEAEQSDDDEPEGDDPKQPQTIKLKDGTEVTLEDVEKGLMRDADYRRKTMELAEHRKAVQAREAEIAQKSQTFDQHINFALELVAAHLPQPPDAALIQSDPIGYWQQRAEYDERIGQLQQLVAAKQEADAHRQQETTRAVQERLKGEVEALASAIPELKDPAKSKQVLSEIIEGAKHYGFTQDDVNLADDHRLFLMARDAAAYRKLMANKPKAEAKAKTAAPMQKPGARVSPQAAKGKVAKDKWNALRRNGSLEDGASVLLDLVKGT